MIRKIYSLNLISYLRYCGVEEERISLDSSTNKVYFVYDKSDLKIEKLIKEYQSGKVVVNLLSFVSEFRKVKQDIYAFMNM